MQIEQISVGAFEMNCYVVSTSDRRHCFIIDPGDEPERIIGYIEHENLVPERIILTHCHIDHARRAAEVQQHYDLPLYLGEEDVPLLESLNDQARMFGFEKTQLPEISGFLDEKEVFPFGDSKARMLHTPGHSPGSFCIHIEQHLFVGDVLFQDSIGRTDLYRGSYKELIHSIQHKLLVLSDDTKVYPGHGPHTTIGREKTHNPFINNLL